MGTGIFGVTALGMGIMAGIVAVGVAKGELDPSPEVRHKACPGTQVVGYSMCTRILFFLLLFIAPRTPLLSAISRSFCYKVAPRIDAQGLHTRSLGSWYGRRLNAGVLSKRGEEPNIVAVGSCLNSMQQSLGSDVRSVDVRNRCELSSSCLDCSLPLLAVGWRVSDGCIAWWWFPQDR